MTDPNAPAAATPVATAQPGQPIHVSVAALPPALDNTWFRYLAGMALTAILAFLAARYGITPTTPVQPLPSVMIVTPDASVGGYRADSLKVQTAAPSK